MNLQTLKANNQNKLFNYNNLFLNVVNLYNNKEKQINSCKSHLKYTLFMSIHFIST